MEVIMERTWQFDRYEPIWPEPADRFPLEQYPFRLGLRRKNRSGSGPYWDPRWHECGLLAARELCESIALFEAQLRFAREDERDAVLSRAEELYAQRRPAQYS